MRGSSTNRGTRPHKGYPSSPGNAVRVRKRDLAETATKLFQNWLVEIICETLPYQIIGDFRNLSDDLL